MESVIYEEKSIAWESLFFFSFGLLFLALLLLALGGVQVGTRPAPWWVYFIFTVLFFFLGVAFSSFALQCTMHEIRAGYLIYRVRVPYENIVKVEPAKISVWKTGGYGIRAFRHNGQKALAVVRSRNGQVLMTLRDFRYAYLLISSRDPEIFMQHVRARLQGARPSDPE